jgi:hypothetical protein
MYNISHNAIEIWGDTLNRQMAVAFVGAEVRGDRKRWLLV